MTNREQIMTEIIQKQDELIQELLSQCLNVRSTKNELILIARRVDIASLKSRLVEAEEEKTTRSTNTNCRIDKLEFNCGYDNSCVDCSNYIPYV